jgi:hypothetical protein
MEDLKHPLLISLGIVAALLGSCSAVVSKYERAYEATSDGDPIELAIARFGEPTVREWSNTPFMRYANHPCEGTCVERLWWEHPVLRGFEAWSVELDASGRVVEKAKWFSP